MGGRGAGKKGNSYKLQPQNKTQAIATVQAAEALNTLLNEAGLPAWLLAVLPPADPQHAARLLFGV